MPNPGDPGKKRISLFGIVRAVPPERLRTTEAAAGPPDQPVTDFKDNGGKLLRSPKLVLMFWGTAWNGKPTPSQNDVVQAISSILSSAYMFKLLQYRGIGNASLLAADVAGQSDPPNPFSNEDILTFLGSRMKSGAVPSSDTNPDAFYCVILPQGTKTSETGPGGESLAGQHNAWAGITFFCWVRNDGSLTDRNSIPKVLTHELVEACTDPEPGSGIVVTANGALQEIGDVCNDQVQLLNGVGVQPYWSQSDLQCVAPRQRSVAWYLGVLGINVRPVSLRSVADARNTKSLVGLMSLPL